MYSRSPRLDEDVETVAKSRGFQHQSKDLASLNIWPQICFNASQSTKLWLASRVPWPSNFKSN